MSAPGPVGRQVADLESLPAAAVCCPGCLGRKPPRRLICLACEHVLPGPLRHELDLTAGRPLTHPRRAVATADALTWLRIRREGRHV